MIGYIDTTIKALAPESVFTWDVVSEAVRGGPDRPGELFKDTTWSKIPDFFCKAYKAARKANPKALLMYNDYGFETGLGWEKHKADKIFKLLKENRICGVKGIGFQSHIQSNYSPEQMEGIRT